MPKTEEIDENAVGTAVLNRYLSRLTRKAHRDGRLADAYARVAAMERRPVSLLCPGVAWRVLGPAVGPWQETSGKPRPTQALDSDVSAGDDT